jgi:hypothetical protein
MLPEAIIPNTHARFVSIAEALLVKLHEIQDIAKAGSWENLDLQPAPFLTEMAALRAFEKLPIVDPDDRRLINDVQQMLQTTIAQCATRMEQIGPLIKAFERNQKSSETP